LVKRIQTAVGFDPINKMWLEKHTETTRESMSDFLNKRVDEYREANPDLPQSKEAIVVHSSAAAKRKSEADENAIKLFLRENDHILYLTTRQRKTTKSDLQKIKDELFFSKYKVDTTTEVIRTVLRDEIEKFDVAAYEKRKGIKKARK